jgi:hypothetical protein
MRTEILQSLPVFAFASLAHIHLEQLLPCCYVEFLKCHATCLFSFSGPEPGGAPWSENSYDIRPTDVSFPLFSL